MTLAMPFDPPVPARPPEPRRRLRLVEDAPPRPKTRADCVDGPRPCPWVGCRHNTFLEVDRYDGGTLPSIRVAHPGRQPWQVPPGESCTLDLVGGYVGDPIASQETGRILRITPDWVRKVERMAFERIKAEHPNLFEQLRDQLGAESFDDVLAQGAWGESDGLDPEPGATAQQQVDAWAERVLAAMREGGSLAQAWANANEQETTGMSEKTETIHVFTCSVDPEHSHRISDDGRPEGQAFAIALRQTRLRFVGGRCDTWVPGERGRVQCKGQVRERTETEAL